MIIRAIPLLGLILALSFSSSAALITGVTIEDFSTEYPNRSAVDSINGTAFQAGCTTTAQTTCG